MAVGEATGNVVQGCAPGWTVTRADQPDEALESRDGLDGLDDAGLVAACQAGRRVAFDIIVDRHRRSIYNLCYRFTSKHEDAADLAQEVFLRAYRAIGRFRGDASVTTWLYRIGVNACLNRVSQKAAPHVALDDAPELTASTPDPSDDLDAAERAAVVRAAVAELPERQRATLVLRIYHERSHKEIAAILGTSEGAAKANLFHALANLKKRLAGRVR